MANLRENNFHNIRMNINKDEYYDFFVYKDSYVSYRFNNQITSDGIISHIDMCDKECHDENGWIYGKKNEVWDKAVAIENTLYNITYTGFDNGLFNFRKDRISNKDFFELFQKQKYNIKEGDYRLKLHQVTGSTLLYDYPITFEECQVKLNGGFFQGFFQTECDKYKVLPSKIDNGDVWGFEFQLKKCDIEKESDKTLNDKYPNNKGIFFFMGTRAENKWTYLYDKDDKYKLEESNPLSPDNYVEDGEINKSDYIIGNFYDLDIEFPGPETKIKFDDLDDYMNFNYYDPKLYEEKPCNLDGLDIMDYYIESNTKAKLIDENQPHETLKGWCCNNKGDEKDTEETNDINNKKVEYIERDPDYDYNDPFGEDYIEDLDNINDGEDFDYLEPEMNISDFEYETENGFKFSEANHKYLMSDNKFLLFNRTCTGYTTDNWVEGNEVMFTYLNNKFKGNLFILMNRTCTGYTVDNIDTLRNKDINNHNPYKDIYNNAFALRIKDDGSIGYRILTKDCDISGENKTKIIEGYSNPNIIPNCEWCSVFVKIYGTSGGMKIYFYVNGKLVYITKELPRIDLRKLDELYEKQEGVPYNISIGGGTQGLSETILQNYMLNPTRVYPLEEYFAGSFIGYIRDFKFYTENLEYMEIFNNYKYRRL